MIKKFILSKYYYPVVFVVIGLLLLYSLIGVE